MGDLIQSERQRILSMVDDERNRQNQLWGFPQRNNLAEWGCILAEETGELCKELNDMHFSKGSKERIITEAIQVAAVAVSIIEHMELFITMKEDMKKVR